MRCYGLHGWTIAARSFGRFGSNAPTADRCQGSTKLQANLTTNVSYSYPPFGSLGARSTSSLNTFRYTGREASDNTGLYYYRGRYYSPGQSRFIQEDPLGLVAGSNIYTYVNNSPLSLSDPLGLQAPQIYSSKDFYAQAGHYQDPNGYLAEQAGASSMHGYTSGSDLNNGLSQISPSTSSYLTEAAAISAAAGQPELALSFGGLAALQNALSYSAGNTSGAQTIANLGVDAATSTLPPLIGFTLNTALSDAATLVMNNLPPQQGKHCNGP